MLHKLGGTIAKGILKSFYKASVTLTPKLDKDIPKANKQKLQPKISYEHIWKILNRIQYIKVVARHDQAQFTSGMQDWLNIKKSSHVIRHVNKLKKNI